MRRLSVLLLVLLILALGFWLLDVMGSNYAVSSYETLHPAPEPFFPTIEDQCSLQRGAWVESPSEPLSCPAFILETFGHMQGTHCTKPIQWAWQSSQPHCSIPSPTTTSLFASFAGHDVLFVGDALAGNQFVSLCCQLSSFISKDERVPLSDKIIDTVATSTTTATPYLDTGPVEQKCVLRDNTQLRFVRSASLFSDVVAHNTTLFRQIWEDILDTTHASQTIVLSLAPPTTTAVDASVAASEISRAVSLRHTTLSPPSRQVFLRSHLPPHPGCWTATGPDEPVEVSFHRLESILHFFLSKSQTDYAFLDARPLRFRRDQHALHHSAGLVDCTTYCVSGPVQSLNALLFGQTITRRPASRSEPSLSTPSAPNPDPNLPTSPHRVATNAPNSPSPIPPPFPDPPSSRPSAPPSPDPVSTNASPSRHQSTSPSPDAGSTNASQSPPSPSPDAGSTNASPSSRSNSSLAANTSRSFGEDSVNYDDGRLLRYPDHPLIVAQEFETCKRDIDAVFQMRNESLEHDYPHRPLGLHQFEILNYTAEIVVPGLWFLQLKILETKHIHFWCDLWGNAKVSCEMDYSGHILTLQQQIVDSGVYEVRLQSMTITPEHTSSPLYKLYPLWFPVPLPSLVKKFTATIPPSSPYVVDYTTDLPQCSNWSPPGRWVSIPEVVANTAVPSIFHLSSRALLPPPTASVLHRSMFTNTTLRGAGFVFLPYDCSLRWYAKEDIAVCMRAKGIDSLSLMGTSRTRTEAFDANALVLDNIDSEWLNFTWASKTHNDLDFFFDDTLRFSYVWGIDATDMDEDKHWVGDHQAWYLRESLKREGLCQNPPVNPTPKGALFITTGLWELYGQWEDYPAFTDKLLLELKHCTAEEKRFIIFKTSEPLVLSGDVAHSSPIWQQELQTNCAIDKFSAAGFPILDSRQPMKARSDASHDGIHYYLLGEDCISSSVLGNAVSVTLTQMMFNAICSP